MSRKALIASLATLALVLSGCGEDEDERARTVGAPASDASDAEAEDSEESQSASRDVDLEAALLTLDDMPTGWTTDTVEATGNDSDSATLCGAELIEEVEPAGEVSADFSAGDLGPLLNHSILEYEDDEAARVLTDFADALAGCEEWTEETDEGPMTLRPTPLSFPSLGDETVAVRIDAANELVDMTMDMVVWRHGDTLNIITMMEAFGTPDGEQTEEFATLADERIASLL